MFLGPLKSTITAAVASFLCIVFIGREDIPFHDLEDDSHRRMCIRILHADRPSLPPPVEWEVSEVWVLAASTSRRSDVLNGC